MARDWMGRLRRGLPPHTHEVVLIELARSERAGLGWTPLRPYLHGEPLGLPGPCQGRWPDTGKGKLIPCPRPATHVRYAAGGAARGMDLIMCEECACSFELEEEEQE